MLTLKAALEIVRNFASQDGDEDQFLAACEYLIDHRGELTHRVFIDIPDPDDMLTTNTDSKWDYLRENSLSRCSCGNERIIMPLTVRSEYQGTVGDPIVLSVGDELYIKPIGGDKKSAYLRVCVIDRDGSIVVALLKNPFDHVFNIMEILGGPPSFMLRDIISRAYEDGDLVLMYRDEDFNIPILKIVGVTEDSLTIRLDAAVEAFDPNNVRTGHEH